MPNNGVSGGQEERAQGTAGHAWTKVANRVNRKQN